LPPEWAIATTTLPQHLQGTILVTVHPEHVARAALETVGFVIAVGVDPAATLRSFCCAVSEDPPAMRVGHIDRGLAYFWEPRERRLRRVRINEPRQHLRRHTRKAEGDLGEDRSFYFRGPEALSGGTIERPVLQRLLSEIRLARFRSLSFTRSARLMAA
jgi:hypothetical protein